MIRVLVKNGLLHPMDPLPEGWDEGEQVEISGEPSKYEAERLLRCMHEVAELAQNIEVEDWRQVEEAIAEQDRWGKEHVRREMEPGQ